MQRPHYFFLDIYREGILLYDAGRQALETPRGTTPTIRLAKAKEEFDYWFESGEEFYECVIVDI